MKYNFDMYTGNKDSRTSRFYLFKDILLFLYTFSFLLSLPPSDMYHQLIIEYKDY